MLKPNVEKAIKLWSELVYDRTPEVDPNEEHDWESIALGFFLALGFTAQESLNIYYEHLIPLGKF